jgi:hypothetical protein
MLTFARELETYKTKLPELPAQDGQFVLIHENTVEGCYDTYGDAMTAGYQAFGLNLFLVKRIEALETPIFITRNVCPSSS